MAYLPALSAGYVWDDDVYLWQNPSLRNLEGLRDIWLKPGATVQYYPMVFSMFWVEARLWGLDEPFALHLVNVLLHAGNCVLVWLVLRDLRVAGALPAALLFAVHPIHVESVAWITERKNALSMFFMLLSAWFYLRFVGLCPDRATARRSDYAIALGMYLFGLLSKTVVCTLPAGLVAVTWWKRGRLTRRDVAALAPMFVLGAILGAITVWVERYPVEAQGSDWALSMTQRALIAGRALWFYLGKLVWPVDLVFVYPRWIPEAKDAAAFIAPASAVGLALLLFLARAWIGRGPLTAYAWYVLTLAPALGFIDLYYMRFSMVADHFAYIPSLGPIALAGAILAGSRSTTSNKSAGAEAVARIAIIAGLTVALAILTYRQAQVYRDAETLWRDTLARNPDAWIAHNNLGVLLTERQQLDEADMHLRQVVRLKPDYAPGWYNLGVVLMRSGRFEEALAHCRQAVQLEDRNPVAHNCLGSAYFLLKRLEEAVGEYKKALELAPNYVDAHYNLGCVYEDLGRADEAVEEYRAVLRSDPSHEGAAAHLRRLAP